MYGLERLNIERCKERFVSGLLYTGLPCKGCRVNGGAPVKGDL